MIFQEFVNAEQIIVEFCQRENIFKLQSNAHYEFYKPDHIETGKYSWIHSHTQIQTLSISKITIYFLKQIIYRAALKY